MEELHEDNVDLELLRHFGAWFFLAEAYHQWRGQTSPLQGHSLDLWKIMNENRWLDLQLRDSSLMTSLTFLQGLVLIRWLQFHFYHNDFRLIQISVQTFEIVFFRPKKDFWNQFTGYKHYKIDPLLTKKASVVSTSRHLRFTPNFWFGNWNSWVFVEKEKH